MKEESKAELGGVAGHGGPHGTIADARPKIFWIFGEDESPMDSNRPGTPWQNNQITELDVAWTPQ